MPRLLSDVSVPCLSCSYFLQCCNLLRGNISVNACQDAMLGASHRELNVCLLQCRTTVFSHSQSVVVCSSCSAVLCTPTGGKARLTEGGPLMSISLL